MNDIRSSVSSDKGFTLLEILLVVSIIAILASIVVFAINPLAIFRKVRDTTRYTDIRNVENAIVMYIIDHGHAPYLQDHCGPSTPDGNCFTNETPGSPYSWDLLDQDLKPYLYETPRDPCGEKCFENRKFYSYNYYAPSYYLSVCGDGGCGTPVSTSDAAKMYSVYAENLESKEGSFGTGVNPFHSY